MSIFSLQNMASNTLSSSSIQTSSIEEASNFASNDKELSQTGKRKFSSELKLKILAEARLTSGEAAARKYKIDSRRIRDWKTKVDKLSKYNWRF